MFLKSLGDDVSRSRIVRAGALLVLVSTLVSCSGLGQSDNEQVAQNRAQWVMPVDEFRVWSPELANYAEQLLIAECLEPQGYSWPVAYRDTSFPEPLDFNATGLRLFNIDIAEQWGYHHAPAADVAEAQRVLDSHNAMDETIQQPGFDAVFEACSDKVRAPDFEQIQNDFNFTAGIAMQASAVADQDEDVLAAAKKWKACLEPSVSFELPDAPFGELGYMPPNEVAESWGITGPSKTASADAEEIRVAIADAECRETSGLDEARYQAEWDAQLPLIAENRDKLESIRKTALEDNTKNLEIVAEHAGG